jgi:5-methylcytosine-specific restriction endonuclease McrA
LLKSGRAVVARRTPFTIRLKDRHSSECETQGVVVGIDPGSKTTGIAVWQENTPGVREAVFLAEVEHRGSAISKKLEQRSNYRRRRRTQNLRYRAPRFNNRDRSAGWLASSLQHRVDTTVAWVNRLAQWAPVVGVEMELVRFDMQVMQNPEISGVEYQQGELYGYEVREYLLNKWGRKCAYCDAQNVPLQVEHIRPKARGGSNRVSNLTLACQPCNQAKDARPVEEFLAHDPVRLARIVKNAKAPLRDAAAVNSTRWALFNALSKSHTVLTGTGGQTKYNRTRFDLPKTHALDALAVGHPDRVTNIHAGVTKTLTITCNGRGQYQRTKTDKYGFPRLRYTRVKQHFGYQTGDLVRAVVPSGKKQGTHTGRVAVRATGSFNINTTAGTVQGISHKHCGVLQRGDGYGYLWKEDGAFLPALKDRASSAKVK